MAGWRVGRVKISRSRSIYTQVCPPLSAGVRSRDECENAKNEGFALSLFLSFSLSRDGAQLPIDFYIFVRRSVYANFITD